MNFLNVLDRRDEEFLQLFKELGNDINCSRQLLIILKSWYLLIPSEELKIHN